MPSNATGSGDLDTRRHDIRDSGIHDIDKSREWPDASLRCVNLISLTMHILDTNGTMVHIVEVRSMTA